MGLVNAGAIVFATARSIPQADLYPGITKITCDQTDDERWNGSVVVAAALAAEYGFRDIDAPRPRRLILADLLVNPLAAKSARGVDGNHRDCSVPTHGGID